MRRENRRHRVEEEGIDTKKMLYITGSVLAVAIIVFVVSFFVYGNIIGNNSKIAQLNNNTIGNLVAVEEASTSYGKTVNEVQEEQAKSEETNKVAVNTSQIIGNTTNSNDKTKEDERKTSSNNNSNNENKTNTTNVNKTASNSENETVQNSQKNEKVKDPEFKMPVTGEIVKEFADNKLVYSNTLDVWATHNGIDIKADKTSVVKASADGQVTSIKNDPRYGLTVIIEHTNGYKTVYANLLSTEFVVEGETVKQGQSVGTVGNSASFEISDEPHLHFELLKENEQQDPELYIKK